MSTIKTLQIEQLDAQIILSKFSSLEYALNEIRLQITPQRPNVYLTRQEVADLFKVTKVTIWDWTRKGILRPYRIGRYIRYIQSEVYESAVLIEKKIQI
ncbi:hypothetical protein GCM10027299_34610 [Larkinella ripae]